MLFTPSGRNVLADIDFTKHWLVVSQMDDGSPRVELLGPPADLEGEWTRRDFALPAASQSYVDSIDSERDDTVLVHVEHFLTPPSLYYADFAQPESEWQLLARLPAQFDASGLIAERRHAISTDGVAIPYWLIGREANVEGSISQRPACSTATAVSKSRSTRITTRPRASRGSKAAGCTRSRTFAAAASSGRNGIRRRSVRSARSPSMTSSPLQKRWWRRA